MENKDSAILRLRTVSHNWLSELEFMKDEQYFLEHLLSTHFIDLSTEKLYEPTRKLIRRLKDTEELGTDLINDVHHFNHQIVSAVESHQELVNSSVIKIHKEILKDFENYTLKFRYVKKKIFALIKEIMIHHKQKLLINKT